jgi:hypothetical protein
MNEAVTKIRYRVQYLTSAGFWRNAWLPGDDEDATYESLPEAEYTAQRAYANGWATVRIMRETTIYENVPWSPDND